MVCEDIIGCHLLGQEVAEVIRGAWEGGPVEGRHQANGSGATMTSRQTVCG